MSHLSPHRSRRVFRLTLILSFFLALSGVTHAQYFGRNKVQYGKFDFKVLKTEHFDIHYYSSEAAAAPSGFSNFGNAQDTVNALQARGYNVQINGATVPLSSCKAIGVEGLNDSNIDSAGPRIDPTKFDTVYVDVSCRGG